MAAKIKKGDKVVVLTGRDKGKTGEVVQVLPKEERAVVRGVNVVKRHQLQAMFAEGLENRYARHAKLNAMVHDWVRRNGTSDSHKYQRHLYALGAMQAGILDSGQTIWVGNLYFDRSGKEHHHQQQRTRPRRGVHDCLRHPFLSITS